MKTFCVLPPSVGGNLLLISNSRQAPGKFSKILIFSELVLIFKKNPQISILYKKK